MARLGKLPSHAPLPGEYGTPRPVPPKKLVPKNAPVVVKLNTGERVSLLAADKPPAKKPPHNPWDSPCRLIRTIPSKLSAFDSPSCPEGGTRAPLLGRLYTPGDGNRISRVDRIETRRVVSENPSVAPYVVPYAMLKAEPKMAPKEEPKTAPRTVPRVMPRAALGTRPEVASHVARTVGPKVAPYLALFASCFNAGDQQSAKSSLSSIKPTQGDDIPNTDGGMETPKSTSNEPAQAHGSHDGTSSEQQPLLGKQTMIEDQAAASEVEDSVSAVLLELGAPSVQKDVASERLSSEIALCIGSRVSRQLTSSIPDGSFLGISHQISSGSKHWLNVSSQDKLAGTPEWQFQALRDIESQNTRTQDTSIQHASAQDSSTQDTPIRDISAQEVSDAHLLSASVDEIARSSAESGSPWLASPQALVSFSPEDIAQAQTRVQISFTLNEVVQSEYAYVKSLLLLGNFFVEPLLVKCTGVRITCTPLLNMDVVIKALRAKHERFLARVSSEKSLAQLAYEMISVVAEPRYGHYAACAELLLFLVHRQVPPFELSYVANLQTFLERNQPGERRMDLLLSLLLQKPMGRIAKYRLFLGLLAKLCPENQQVVDAMASVNEKLTEINDEIRNNKERQAVLESVATWLDLSDTPVPVYQFFGLLNLLGQCTALWLTYSRHGPLDVVARESHLLLHDNHVIFVDARSQRPLFILSFANCQFIADPTSSVGGLYSDSACSVKLIFEKGDCQYELMLVSNSADAHEALLRACANIPRSALHYNSTSDADCYIGPTMAQFDINLNSSHALHTQSPTCYFRQVYRVCQRPADSRLRTMGSLFRRGFNWQGHH